MGETEEKAEGELSNQSQVTCLKHGTCEPERTVITGAISWVRKLKYIEAGDIRMEMNTY